jgi:outer membrane protein with beta-barrel domain
VRRTLLFCIVMIVAPAALAQNISRFDLFAGYSFDHAAFSITPDNTIEPQAHEFLNGWNGSATVHLNRWIGVAADFAGYYSSHEVSEGIFVPPPSCFIACTPAFGTTLHSVHTFTFGPQLSVHQETVTFFARALFGGARTHQTFDQFPAAVQSVTETNFAYIVDGGIDAGISKHLAIRIQPGYLRTEILKQHRNNLRFSAGLVWRIGR